MMKLKVKSEYRVWYKKYRERLSKFNNGNCTTVIAFNSKEAKQIVENDNPGYKATIARPILTYCNFEK